LTSIGISITFVSSIKQNDNNMANKTTYAAWTRKSNSNDQFCTQLIEAKTAKEAKQKIIEGGREIDGKVYKYKA